MWVHLEARVFKRKKGLDNVKFHSLHNSRDRPRPCISLQKTHNGVKSYFELYLNSWISRFHQIFLNFQSFWLRDIGYLKRSGFPLRPLKCYKISHFCFEFNVTSNQNLEISWIFCRWSDLFAFFALVEMKFINLFGD